MTRLAVCRARLYTENGDRLGHFAVISRNPETDSGATHRCGQVKEKSGKCTGTLGLWEEEYGGALTSCAVIDKAIVARIVKVAISQIEPSPFAGIPVIPYIDWICSIGTII
jgi:hypothetical protein